MKTKRILSLLLAITVMATMLIAFPLTGYAADGDAYAEWVLSSMSSFATGNQTITNTNITTATVPTLSIAGSVASSKLTPAVQVTQNADFTSYSGNTTYSINNAYNGMKFQSANSITIDTKFSTLKESSGFASYDLFIVYCLKANTAQGIKVTLDSGTEELKGAGDTQASIALTSFKLTDLTADTITLGRNKEISIDYIGIKYNAPSTEPEISINEPSLTLTTNETSTLTTTTKNVDDSVEVTWSSDNEAVATVENGTVTAVSAGTANISASITVDGTTYNSSNSCAITVKDTKTVSIDKGAGVKSITITDMSNSDNIKTINYIRGNAVEQLELLPGTYSISATHSNYYIESEGNTTEITVAPNQDAVIIAQDSLDTTEKTTDTSKISGDVVWNFKTQVGNDIEYIQAEKGDPIYVESTNTNGVYLKVDASNGKFNLGARSTDAQVNANTVLSVPVVAGSEIEVTTSTSYAPASIGGVAQTKNTTGLYTYTCTDTDVENGYVDIVSDGGYYYTITVKAPEPPKYTGVVTADKMTLNNNNKGTATITISDQTEAYTGEYADVFGDLSQYTKEVGYLNAADRSASTSYTLVEGGVYKIYALADYARSTNLLTLTKEDGTSVVTAVSPVQSEVLAVAGTQDVIVYSYVVGNLEAGNYELTFGSGSEEGSAASDLIALAIVPYGELLSGVSDSGYYYAAEDTAEEIKLGVIRFLQGYTGVEVSSYGFQFTDSEGTIIKQEAYVTANGNIDYGFYADLTNIPSTETGTYYAVASVVLADGTTINSAPITGNVDWDKLVNYPEQ